MAARYGPQSIGQRVTRFCQPPIIVFDAPRDSVHLKLIKTHPANYSCHVSSAIRQIKARVLARNTRAKSWPYEKVLRVPRNAASTFYLHWYLLENVTGKRQREEKINRSQEAEKQRERERERERWRGARKRRASSFCLRARENRSSCQSQRHIAKFCPITAFRAAAVIYLFIYVAARN